MDMSILQNGSDIQDLDLLTMCDHFKMGRPWGDSGPLFITFSDYSENSTVHGVKYITDKVELTKFKNLRSMICLDNTFHRPCYLDLCCFMCSSNVWIFSL